MLWMYHPVQGAKLFKSEKDVPKGWYDSPVKAANVLKGLKKGQKEDGNSKGSDTSKS